MVSINVKKYEIDDELHKEVMLSGYEIYKMHSDFYKKNQIFPQEIFSNGEVDGLSEKQLSQYMTLAAYFDFMKYSRLHYTKDMKNFMHLAKTSKLRHELTGNSEDFLTNSFKFNENNKINDMFEYLTNLDDLTLNYFVRKILKSPLKKIINGEIPNRQRDFRNMMEFYLKEYNGNPANSFTHKTDYENAYQTFLERPGFGRGTSYLATLFHAETKLSDITRKDLIIPPKVDWNDIHMIQHIRVFKQKNSLARDYLIDVIAEEMQNVASKTNLSIVEIDDMYWASAQISNMTPSLTRYSEYIPFINFINRDEVRKNPSSLTGYYKRGKMKPIEIINP